MDFDDETLDHQGFLYYQEKLSEARNQKESLTKTLWTLAFGIMIGRIIATPEIEISKIEVIVSTAVFMGIHMHQSRKIEKNAERYRPKDYYQNIKEYDSMYDRYLNIQRKHSD